MYAAADVDGGLKLWAGGQLLDNKLRREILDGVRGGGALPDIEFEATTYIQRSTPNRNYVRFKRSILAGLAKSYKTGAAPFLKNHDTYDTASRGGTCLDAKAEAGEDGAVNFLMRTKCASLSAPWAALGILEGTIDRFSIGWSRTGPVECSIHKCTVFTECDCYPGDMIGEDVCEFVFTAADGTEYSGVNVPAVVGTRITTISQLAALDRATLKDILGNEKPPIPKKDDTMDPQILAALGLQPTATLAEVLAAINTGKLTELSLAKMREQLETQATANRKGTIDAACARLAAAGKIKPGGDVELSLRRLADVGSELADSTQRQSALVASLDLFNKQVGELLGAPSVTPAGAPLPAGGPDPVPAGPQLGTVLDGKAHLAANPELGGWLKRAGISADQYDKHGAAAREHIAQLHASGLR